MQLISLVANMFLASSIELAQSWDLVVVKTFFPKLWFLVMFGSIDVNQAL